MTRHMSTDSEIGEVIARVRQRHLTVCENCGGQGYTDGGTTACGICLGAGVTTPELLKALRQHSAYRDALESIATGEAVVFDEGEEREVIVPMDHEEMGEIAYEVLKVGVYS